MLVQIYIIRRSLYVGTCAFGKQIVHDLFLFFHLMVLFVLKNRGKTISINLWIMHSQNVSIHALKFGYLKACSKLSGNNIH